MRRNSLPENMEEDILMQIPDYKRKKEEEQAEKRYIDEQLKKIGNEVQDIVNMNEVDENTRVASLEAIKQKYQKTVQELNNIVSPQHRQTITLLKSLKEPNDEEEDDNQEYE